MASTAGLDTTLQYARAQSIQALQEGRTDYLFNQFSVEAFTRNNNGVVMFGDEPFTQKCFFISVVQALEGLGTTVDLLELVIDCEMLNDTLIDTDNIEHQAIVRKVADRFNLKIEFYIGQLRDSWHTTPYPSTIIGNGARTIRILNCGSHFELLTGLEDGFISDVANATDIVSEQHKLLADLANHDARKRDASNCREQEDFALAARLTEQEKKKQSQELDDAAMAQRLAEQNEKYREVDNAEFAEYMGQIQIIPCVVYIYEPHMPIFYY